MSDTDFIKQLDEALGRILPVSVEHSVCAIAESCHIEFESEADFLRTAGDYRKCEFAAGRDCARAAMGKLGMPRMPILSDEDGVPLWPRAALGAISHSRGYCAAIATKENHYTVLGLDLEMTNRLSPAAIERTVHPDEQVYVQSDQKKASLIFCAKEAFFKAQFPVWQTHANFHDLILSVDPDKGSLSILGMGERFPEELRCLAADFRFRFTYVGDFVVTVCWLKPKF